MPFNENTPTPCQEWGMQTEHTALGFWENKKWFKVGEMESPPVRPAGLPPTPPEPEKGETPRHQASWWPPGTLPRPTGEEDCLLVVTSNLGGWIPMFLFIHTQFMGGLSHIVVADSLWSHGL